MEKEVWQSARRTSDKLLSNSLYNRCYWRHSGWFRGKGTKHITVDLINKPVILPRSTAKSSCPLRMRTIPKCSQPSRTILRVSALTVTTFKKLVPLLRSNRRWSRTARCWVWKGVPGLFSCSSHIWNSVWGHFPKPDQFSCWITHSVPRVG